MRLPVKLDLALAVLRIALIAAILPLAIGWRTPFFASWRTVALTVLLALPLLLIAIEVWTLRRARTRAVRLTSGASLLLALIAFGATATFELSFQYQRSAVLAADPAELERLGRHFLIGYRRRSELQALLDRRAVAGVLISATNVEGKSRDKIRRRIDELQTLRDAQNLAPLWIATDQEGGPVSRVSPPLMRQPSLAEIVALHRDPAERLVAIRHYAAHQGRGLSSLGVNVNFAPVVDLNHGVVNPEDRLSRISSRDLGGSGGRHGSRGALLRDADADRRALYAEALSRPRPRLRGHPPRDGGAFRSVARARAVGLAAVPARHGAGRRFHDAESCALDRSRSRPSCLVLRRGG